MESIEALKDVPVSQLQWWIDNSIHYIIPEQELLFKKGESTKGTHVIVKGRVRLYLKQKDSI